MIHPAMDAEVIRRVAEAHHVAGAAMYRLADAIKEMGDITQPAEPQPKAPPEPGKSRTGGWIVDRVPDAKDSSDEVHGHVRIPQRPGTPQRAPGDALLTCHWSAVHPGQPWAPIGYRVDSPLHQAHG